MPDDAQTTAEPEAVGAEPNPPEAKSPLARKLKLFGFATIVVVAECLVAYLYIPASTDSTAMAALDPTGDPAAEEAFNVGKEADEEPVDVVEVDLGQFAVTSYQPVSATTLRIDFHLYGTVATDQNEAFGEAIQGNQHRIRDQVIVIVRSSELEDITDAGLGLIKRKILEKSNHILGEPFLKTVIFSDFSFIEQ